MTISRRRYLLWFLLFSLVTVTAAKDSPKSKYLLFVGTYTEKESKGIYAYRFDAASSELTPLGIAAEASNPSFLAIDPSHRFLYAVNEVQKYKDANSGVVSAFAIDRQKGDRQTGKVQLLNAVASRGADPCYIAFDKTGKYALVANYTGGSVAVFPVQPDGHIGESSAFVQHVGSSVNRERQEGPHAHWIETTPDNRFAIAVDLGLDELLVYRFDAKTGSLTPNNPPYAKLDPGAGPRHLAFHPNGKFAYVVNELQSSITAFAYDASRGTLHKLKTVSTLPKNFLGNNDTAEIKVHPGGKFLFASNRGHDTIAVFSIHSKTGALTLADHFPTQGKTPRNFEIGPTGKLLFQSRYQQHRGVSDRLQQRPTNPHETDTPSPLTRLPEVHGRRIRASSPGALAVPAQGRWLAYPHDRPWGNRVPPRNPSSVSIGECCSRSGSFRFAAPVQNRRIRCARKNVEWADRQTIILLERRRLPSGSGGW